MLLLPPALLVLYSGTSSFYGPSRAKCSLPCHVYSLVPTPTRVAGGFHYASISLLASAVQSTKTVCQKLRRAKNEKKEKSTWISKIALKWPRKQFNFIYSQVSYQITPKFFQKTISNLLMKREIHNLSSRRVTIGKRAQSHVRFKPRHLLT